LGKGGEKMTCWCGKNHDTISQRGGVINGPIKHSVWNWKLYDLRKDGQGKELEPKKDLLQATLA